ncbi:MAG TPA: SET domain-containing protein-lysine N-methyltransferase [Candidatus Binataceae bacterium]|nr:SET domain-containing protein-lysine N-methyltransferase [Candidatus Binataceae bacterium]
MHIVFPKVLIELRRSAIAGVGVYAAAGLRRDQRIADGIHESDYRRLISWSYLEAYDRAVQEKIGAFCVGTPTGFIPPEKLDFNRLSIEWYLNHSCAGNVGFDAKGDFVARRPIERGEELTYDYGLAESNPRFRMECKCEASACRKTITGDDWRDAGFRDRNLNYMLPRLRRAARSLSEVSVRVDALRR